MKNEELTNSPELIVSIGDEPTPKITSGHEYCDLVYDVLHSGLKVTQASPTSWCCFFPIEPSFKDSLKNSLARNSELRMRSFFSLDFCAA